MGNYKNYSLKYNCELEGLTIDQLAMALQLDPEVLGSIDGGWITPTKGVYFHKIRLFFSFDPIEYLMYCKWRLSKTEEWKCNNYEPTPKPWNDSDWSGEGLELIDLNSSCTKDMSRLIMRSNDVYLLEDRYTHIGR